MNTMPKQNNHPTNNKLLKTGWKMLFTGYFISFLLIVFGTFFISDVSLKNLPENEQVKAMWFGYGLMIGLIISITLIVWAAMLAILSLWREQGGKKLLIYSAVVTPIIIFISPWVIMYISSFISGNNL